MRGRRRIHGNEGIPDYSAWGMYGLAAAAVDVGAGAADAIHQTDWVGSKNRSAARGIAHGDGKTANHHIVIAVARLDGHRKCCAGGLGWPWWNNDREVIERAERVHVEVPIHGRAVVSTIVEIIGTAGGGARYRECETGGTAQGGGEPAGDSKATTVNFAVPVGLLHQVGASDSSDGCRPNKLDAVLINQMG